MKLKTRLMLLLVLMLVASLGAIALLQAIHRAEEKEAITYQHLQREALLNQLIPLLESPLEQLTRDYSQWDDMAAFLIKPDPEWARINIDASLTTFHLTAAWVITPQGQIVYTAKESRIKTAPTYPDASGKILEGLHRDPFLSCYIREGDAVYALRACPIQPSADVQRTSKPQGWLIAVAQIDTDFLQRLGELNNTKAALCPPLPLTADDDHSGKLIHTLHDAFGVPIATIQLDFHTETITSDSNLHEMLLMVSLALILISVVLLSLHFWVLRPFDHITQSLVTGKPENLKPLLNTPTEIGHIARLVRIHFSNQRAMSETMEARAQLARDLHDGVIQSIYAAGMGIAAVQSQIQTEPEAAAAQLQQIRTLLNDTIRETRAFITGLDAGSTDGQPFGAAVEALFASMSWIHKATSVIEIDETVAQNLPRQTREQALQMIREVISNSLRHGRASEIRIALKNGNGKTSLSIADNGIGFDPEQKKPGGHGLANLAERADIIDAQLKIDTAPGKGTRITINFPPPKSTQP